MEMRRGFLKTVSDCNFTYRGIVMEKGKIYGPELIRSKNAFYSYPIKMVLRHSFGAIRDARIRIDGSGNREFRKKLATYLRKEVNQESAIVKDVKFRDSKKDVLIQLADMVAGAIHRSYTEKRDAQIYRNIIKEREDDVWTFCR